MPSESTSPDDRGHVDATVSPRPSPPGAVSTQEIVGSRNASDSTTTPMVQEVPRNGMTVSTICAITINDDDPPIPVRQVADHEKGLEGPQLHDGPPGPPRFPQELDDSLAKKVDNERAAFPASEDRLRQHEDIGSRERTAQETGSSTEVSDSTAAPIVQEEVIQDGMMVSTIHAVNDDGPSIPVWQVADHESEGNQVNSVEFERNLSDRPLDNAATVHSTMVARFANTADVDPPVVVGTHTSTNTTSPGAAGRKATNSGTPTAIVGTRTIVLPQATMVTPGDDNEPKPTIVASIVLPFYQRKGFAYVMVAMALLAIGIALAVPLSSNPQPSSSASPSCSGSLMMIRIQYDSYPSETSYKLEKILSEYGQETELASHIGSTGDNNHEESICLDDGLHSFSIYDSFGDGFNGEYSLTLVPGETIIMQDNSMSPYGEQVLFRLPFDRAAVDVRWIGSDGQLLRSLSPSFSPTFTLSPSYSSQPSSLQPTGSPTLRPTNYPTTSTYQAKLLAPDRAARENFGDSVAIYGDTVVAGAPWDFPNGDNSGSAHVFVRSGEEWTHQATLLAPDVAGGDMFGRSVAIYGDIIVVGAPFDDDNGDNSGSAHVFVRSGEEWTHQAKLLAPDGAAFDWFGESVAIYGDKIVVGADRDDDNGNDSGSAHVLVRSGEEWTHQAKLLAPDGAAWDEFGGSVAIYGDTIVVGAEWDDDNGLNSGSAHVFVRSGEEWTHEAKLLAPDGSTGDDFGNSVAIYGNTIVVGAYEDDDNKEKSGSTYVFVRSGEEWTHQAKLLAPDGAADDKFGESVAIYGDKIVVGADRDDDNGSASGLAHVFVRGGEEWTHQAKLLAPDGAASDWFGGSVAIYVDTTVIGAQNDDDNGSNSGSAHVFVV